MNKSIRILGIGGSLGENSTSLSALTIALDAARKAGAETELLDVRALNLPLYDHSKAIPETVQKIADAVSQSHGMIWSAPLYHGSISGSFKNTLDWLELLSDAPKPYLTAKPIGLVATAGGTQGLQAINSMEYIVRALRGWTVPLVVPIAHAWKGFDESTDAQLVSLGKLVVWAAQRLSI